MSDAEKVKVRNCLAILQEAQGLICAAAAELCSVRGFADEWDALDEPIDIVKKHWHRVDSRRQQLLEAEARRGMSAKAVNGRKER